MRRLIPIILALLTCAAPAAAQLQAPHERATVAAVKAAHPEVNTCDEVARGAIVDWTATRLNTKAGRVLWGRKATRKPEASGAAPVNTDALTYLRTDGKFEVYDVISGSKPACGASWQVPTKALSNNGKENGWWARPQLGAEPGSTPPGDTGSTPDPHQIPPPATNAATAELQQQQLAVLLQIVAQLQAQNVALVQAVNDLKAQVAAGVQIRW